MSRVAKQPVSLPKGVEVRIDAGQVTVKGPKGQLAMALQNGVEIHVEGDRASINWQEDVVHHAGTTRALLANMVHGVSQGFERKLEIIGVGYRAQAKGKTLGLSLGFSHPVEYPVPESITIETPTQTEIVIRGVDKQMVGQVAADIRAYRPPEPYKGKGVRYAGEQVRRKEAKKK
ncbi:50S ribosomal protein L6 [Acidithiobacillus sp. CV18-2]|uniref:Large ribosomal subunit protein uL6 n=1 Tax=Igneacidithiobacillus copahuensis TaxID=2724909 RepID=A0AAE2YMR1_9PROT|nr:50S ribosomal protein L6 [Igneacidithiobacillus copahuensis]MBU2754005.1 50S ribosomal protein L6 [Acidithiobacillus sp. CV18-3]MBU2756233.1 50S ribosomal protein L6 [Acidithiobacillus sp. BN09-2]MBU2778678.1 50S ribosomal protein L6 [Acidithiobacillus sp. CV18-2]MBU2797245.1 50S ribosomal protein L6 [Acidithiobacillus sp. VAN18-2]MBU2798866.1 50S ribosomal protein L6 [Acidithiobacillus sp. VAN18-4]UTV81407.1 50S ribosomal protein L6 [Acidithiobacillus sp. YTS05]